MGGAAQDVLDAIADELERRGEEVAITESRDTGKPLKLARAVDAARSVANFRFFADFGRKLETQTFAMADAMNTVIRKPVGVVGLISPWNLPLYLLSWKVAPALLMGNCVIAKPSELTPLTANLLCECAAAVGLPPGVLNVVHGLGAEVGQALCEHPDVRAISFTGGTATGRVVARTAAPLFKKLSLELGGKNASIVLADADLAVAVPGVVRAGFTNAGQVCLCGSRILVAAAIHDEFVRQLVERVAAMTVGDPATSDMGSLISFAHRDKVESYLKLAAEEGGTILTGGDRPDLPGAFLRPAVITGLSPTSRTSTEEIFGPVVTVHKFDAEDEAVAIANNTQYGLAGSVWTRNAERGAALAARIETGMVWVNTWLHRDLRVPFGGVKSSGVGREGGMWSVNFFSELTNVCVLQGAV